MAKSFLFFFFWSYLFFSNFQIRICFKFKPQLSKMHLARVSTYFCINISFLFTVFIYSLIFEL
jgi:hypothetical protein